MSDALLASLRRAVGRAPADTVLRLHLADLLVRAARADEAIEHLAVVLQVDPECIEARELMVRVLSGDGTASVLARPAPSVPLELDAFDWHAAELQLRDVDPWGFSPGAGEGGAGEDHLGPHGTGPDGTGPHGTGPDGTGPHGTGPHGTGPDGTGPDGTGPDEAGLDGTGPHWADVDWGGSGWIDVERADLERLDGDRTGPGRPQGCTDGVGPEVVRLSDVSGLAEVKRRLEAAFVAPARDPEPRRPDGRPTRGGLLLYGPPGCGKTYLARGVAGELGAGFVHLSLVDLLDRWRGASEQNVHGLFERARRQAPSVVLIDGIDALGRSRGPVTGPALRGVVNQLLAELDGAVASNDGVFVLGATDQPWDVDLALRRPGRLDRAVLVPPPDEEAREGILRTQLSRRPVERIDPRRLARLTDGYSGADLALVCEAAAESALLASASSGVVRRIGMADLEAGIHDIRPSTRPWLETARNVAMSQEAAGEYGELLTYLRKRRLA